ncbi:AAA family ATPase [Sulfitobacter sp. F26204]|uniref:AAA family ATPase n=1 Tax=Sulfitobacter sp. F26204 TaxID=2996014 RepID=UPI00225E325B|nr:AAA family ATPase [Sulfitobacter sp. F26204]MCX7559083.1 AAA family ATPase [Sulfitobacter sp. F26204]
MTPEVSMNPVRSMKRTMILGGPGSGKSTLARLLGPRLGLPVFHMDQIHWQENRVERPMAEKLPMAQAVEEQDSWVFEGGMSVTYGSRMERADLLIWLDLPVGLRLWRVTKPLFRYLGKARPDLPQGCVERLHPETLTFYKFIWQSRHIARAKVAKLVTEARDELVVVHLRRPREVQAWLAGLS